MSCGSECEQTWETKRHANAALVADWKQRQGATVGIDTNGKDSVAALQWENEGDGARDGKVQVGGSSPEGLQTIQSTKRRSAGGGKIDGSCADLHQQNAPNEALSLSSRRATSTVNCDQASQNHLCNGLPSVNNGPVSDSNDDKGHGGNGPRPGTGPCTLLLPDSSALPEYATPERMNSVQNGKSPQTASAAKLGDDRYTPSWKLASARQQLRNLLYRRKKNRPGRKKNNAPSSPPSSQHL